MKFGKLIFSCTGLLTGFALTLGLAINTEAADFNIAKARVDDGIPKSLTGKPGDAKKGRATAIHRKKGNCLACHQMPIKEQQFHGNIGPELEGIGSLYSAGELRLRIVNSKIINPDTIMPAFYRKDGYNRVLKKFKDKTILSAQQVEDIVAYLLTLK